MEQKHISANDRRDSGKTQYMVVYVEDNEINLRLVEKLFKRSPDAQLLSAQTGEEGLKLIQTHLPDLVLLDIHLPGMSGYEVLEKMKQDPQTCNIPAIAVSANAMPADIEKGIKAGFKDYLTKPIEVGSFLRQVEKVLHKG